MRRWAQWWAGFFVSGAGGVAAVAALAVVSLAAVTAEALRHRRRSCNCSRGIGCCGDRCDLAISTLPSSSACTFKAVDTIFAAPIAAVFAWTIVEVVLASCPTPSSSAHANAVAVAAPVTTGLTGLLAGALAFGGLDNCFDFWSTLGASSSIIERQLPGYARVWDRGRWCTSIRNERMLLVDKTLKRINNPL